ncbi:MAG TPA: ATP-binding protein, partial [Thermodesulfobacteriota bacterium]|nr:ATP-binding protein [Thermodesulfobacteriota bacterium]
GIQESFTLREVVRDSDGTPVDLRYLLVNAAAERQLGRMRADLLGHLESGIRGPLDGETRELIDRTMESPRPILQERHDPVSKRWYMACSYSPRVGQIATLSLDVTERKLFEERILQTQKLESLGVLAGGIAHDFNNILQAILGAAEVAATMLPPGSPVQDNLHGISSSARRASDLTAQMLAYAGQGRYKVQLLDISAEIESMREMLAMVISKKAEVAYELAPALPAVRGDLSQLHQIVVNIMINASESLPNGEGTIRVTTASATVDQASLESSWSAEQLRVGRYVSLEISDTGCGMDEATQARIFDPFFTTKFTGRGLGLAAVLGIVRGHKGAIRVRSEPGKGSTFTVLFPQAEASPMPEAGAGRSRT